MSSSYKYLFTLTILLFSCKSKIISTTDSIKISAGKSILVDNAVVVSAHPLASAVGNDILMRGGNAFDAMVATELALAVVYPQAGNIGGGGFAVFHTANGKNGTLDYREKAPVMASKDMYLDRSGHVISGLSSDGALAVGVPGTVSGIEFMYNQYGSKKLSFQELVAPAIKLAYGHALSELQSDVLNRFRESVITHNTRNPYVKKEMWKPGDTLRNPDLAKTLERIANKGARGFYEGETASLIVETMQLKKGIITKADLQNYKATWRDPVTFKYRNHDIISMAPPSSGGICLGQIMGMLQPYNLEKLGHNTVESIAVITEAERRAYADRATYLGDPDFIQIPQKQLLDKNYLNNRMSSWNGVTAKASKELAAGTIALPAESMETTHYSIIDAQGNAISVTTTLNSYFGSKVLVEGAGFFLNNEMDDFSVKPGVANLYGLVGNEANAIAPEKRMLSSMTPTLVLKNGTLVMVVGTPGGSTIITSVFQTISNVIDHKMTMTAAVNAPRFHHQWLPDVIQFEPDSFSTTLLDDLKSKGYIIQEQNAPVIGKVNGVLINAQGKLEGVGDRRGDDFAVGY